MAKTDMTKTQTDERLHSLDALRGIAAFLMIFYHYMVHVQPDITVVFPHPFIRIGAIVSSCGALLVQFFFVLSGFIFYKTYKERIQSHNISLQEFCVMRFSRLYPLAWVTIVFQLVINVWIKFVFGQGSFSIYNILTSALMIDGYWLSKTATSINGPSWSLSAEIMAYLSFFLLTYYSKIKNGILLYVVPIFISILLFNLNLQYPIILPMFVRVFFGFFVGCLTCALYEWGSQNNKMKARITLISGFTIVGVLGIYYFAPSLIGDMSYLGNNIIVFTFMVFAPLLIIVLNVRPIKKCLSLKIFRWLGDLSFSIYMLHFCLITIVMALNTHSLFPTNIVSSRKFIIAIAIITLILAHVSHYYYERPVQAFIRRKYRARCVRGSL